MPMPTRDLKLTYGTLVMGGTSTAYLLDPPMRFSMNADQASVEAEVVVFGTSESDFKTKCAALETAFKTPRQFLEVRFGSAVHETFDATDGTNTGFNQRPSCIKLGGEDDTGRSRRYRVAVSVDLPADLYLNADGSSTRARRSATIVLYTTDSGRRRLSVTGVYTASAVDALGARAQYNARITAYVTSLTTAFGGTWETVFDPQVVTDDQDKICNFAFVLEELIYPQSLAATDDPTLRRQRLSVTRSSDFSGDSVLFGVQPRKLQRTTIDYSVAVDKAVSQDLKGVWEGTVKPFLTSLVQSVAGGQDGFLESEIPVFDPVENRINARVTFISVPGGNILSARITTDESESTGVVLVPVWAGDRLAKNKFTGPGVVTRTVTIVVTEVGLPGSPSFVGSGGVLDILGGSNPPPQGGVVGGADQVSIKNQPNPNQGLANVGGVPEPTNSPDGGDLQRVFLGVVHSSSPRRIGSRDGTTLDVVDRVFVARYEYFVEASNGAKGAEGAQGQQADNQGGGPPAAGGFIGGAASCSGSGP